MPPDESALDCPPKRGNSKLFYAVSLYVLISRNLHLFEPVTGRLFLIRSLPTTDLDTLLLPARLRNVPSPEQGVGLYFVGLFWRYLAVCGPRGYRYVLLDAGEALSLIRAACERTGSILHVAYEFCEPAIDEVLRLDGTETSTILVALLE